MGRRRKPRFRSTLIVATATVLAACPLPYEFNGTGAGDNISSDPSTPSVTAPVEISYSESGGASGTLAEGGAYFAGNSTTVTLSTATENAVIYYTTDGKTISDFGSVKKITSSSGNFTIDRTTGVERRDIFAVAIGPGRFPSPPVTGTVAVSAFPVITVTADDASIPEDSGSTTIRVTASRAPDSDLVIPLTTGGTYEDFDIGMTSPDDIDFTGDPGSIAPGDTLTATIPAGQTEFRYILFSAGDFNEYENDIFTLTADDPTPGAGYAVGTPDTASVEIIDNRTPLLTISVANTTITDNSGFNTITVSSTFPPDSDLTVNLATSGTYEAGDVTGLPGRLTLKAGETSVSRTITANPDVNGLADDESVTVSIAAGSGYIIDTPSSASFVIADSSPIPHITLTVDNTAIDDYQLTYFRINANPAPEVTTRIVLNQSGMDTTWVTQIFSFHDLPAGAASAPITLDPRQENILDPKVGTYTVVANGSPGAPEYTIDSPSSQSVTVTDPYYNPAIPSAGLVAYYPLDGNAIAVAPGGSTGTLTGTSPTANRIGTAGRALLFDGVDDQVQIPAPAGSYFSAGDGVVTVSAWIKKDTPVGLEYFMRPSSAAWGVFTNNATAGLAISNPSTSSASGPFTAGAWNHFVGTFDGSEINVYVNNTLVGTRAHPSTAPAGGTLILGFFNSSYWNGNLDDLRVYDRVLTAAERTALYNE